MATTLAFSRSALTPIEKLLASLAAQLPRAEEGRLARTPLIGVNVDFRESGDAIGYYFVPNGYLKSISKAKGVPIIVPPMDERSLNRAITARCPDGVIEAIESTTEWLAIASQFHPEAGRGTAVDQCIFDLFARVVVWQSSSARMAA